MKKGMAALLCLTLLAGLTGCASRSSDLSGQTFEAGSYVTFGRYEQDNVRINGPEPVEWLVLETDGETAVLISRYALDVRPFDIVPENFACTWDTSEMRMWLNVEDYDGCFLTAAFTKEERKRIVETAVSNGSDQGNGEWGTPGGRNTRDYVFLLSYYEANKYFGSDEARRCAPTDYAKARGAEPDDEYGVDGKGACWWWLRSPGSGDSCAAGVCPDGTVGEEYVEDRSGVGRAVRPVIVVKTKPETDEAAGKTEPAETEPVTPGPGYAAGDVITFGRYEQDNDPSNGPEEIEWIVLESDGNTRKLISRYGLDSICFNDGLLESTTWETCTLREWMNGEFLKTAFTVNERTRLTEVTVKAEKSEYSHTDPGNDTRDRVFLLSADEVCAYYPEAEQRKLKATAYAIEQGAYVDIATGCGRWWLRTPGPLPYIYKIMNHEGFISDTGYTYKDQFVVRPAIVLRSD